MLRRQTLLAVTVVASTLAGLWAFGPPAAAQFGEGGGGFGGGGLQVVTETPASLAGETLIASGGVGVGFPDQPSLFILVSPDKARVWGYSTASGEWKEAPVKNPVDTNAGPVVGSPVAVVTDGRHRHAFSGLTGEWDTLELPEGAEASDAVVGNDYVQVRTKTTVSVFNARNGKWATVEFSKD